MHAAHDATQDREVLLRHVEVHAMYRPFRCESRLVQKSINTPILRALLEGKGLPKAKNTLR